MFYGRGRHEFPRYLPFRDNVTWKRWVGGIIRRLLGTHSHGSDDRREYGWDGHGRRVSEGCDEPERVEYRGTDWSEDDVFYVDWGGGEFGGVGGCLGWLL